MTSFLRQSSTIDQEKRCDIDIVRATEDLEPEEEIQRRTERAAVNVSTAKLIYQIVRIVKFTIEAKRYPLTD
jgi:hypothetical protein